MNRKQYLQDQKERFGRRLFGVFPALFPREIFWAFDVLPVEIWDPPIRIQRSDAHLQPYICPVVKQGLELLLQGEADMLDGLLFPHTCDSIQNLASLLAHQLRWPKPCLFFNHPRAPYGRPARDYYTRLLRGLAAELEKLFGPMDPDRLQWAVEQGRQINRLMGQAYRMRAQGRLAAGHRQFYEAVRSVEWMWPDELAGRLRSLTESAGAPPVNGPPVLLGGVLPDWGLLAALERLGAPAAEDDLLCAGRRLARAGIEPAEDPWQALTNGYFALPPCSTRTSPISQRLEHLAGLAETSGAKGVIFNVVKFCEPELFDLPILMEGLKARGFPCLVLESELETGPTGQMETRLEAFLELLS